MHDALTDLDRQMLAFERLWWWQRAGSKGAAIRDRFALTPTRYHQLLNRLIDRPEALAHNPAVVNRLRRLRESRRGARRSGRMAGWRQPHGG
jgi:transposase